MFLEGLEEQVRLARGDDGVLRAVHEILSWLQADTPRTTRCSHL